MVQEIENFLKGNRNWKHAVVLYQKFGTNNTVKGLIDKYPDTDFVRDKVIEELEELSAKAKLFKPKHVEKKKGPTHLSIPTEEAREIITQLDKRKGKLFRDASILHSHLYHMKYKELQEAVPIIVNNWKEIDRIWMIKNDYIKNKTLPKELTGRYTLNEFVDRLKNLPTYISKLKKEILTLDDGDPLLLKREGRLAVFEAELVKLKEIKENESIIIRS